MSTVLSSDIPEIPKWQVPEVTKQQDLEWAPLHTLDLSQVTGDGFLEVSDDIVQEVGDAFARDGFIYAENHGLSYDEVLRQFDIGQYCFNNISESDKIKYKAKMLENGSFVGYKNAGHWKLNGVQDRIEQFNVGSQYYTPEARKAAFPQDLEPFLPSMERFAKFNHDVILRKVLTVLSRVLKLPADYLWNLSKDPEVKGLDLLRYAMYHTPPKEDDQSLGGVRLQGHTDFNSVSILWSQPITSLEVLMPDNTWRLIKHRPNALVLNLGDAMHFLSGSYLKPTIHRVVAPPQDQAHYTRLGIFYFALFNDDVPLKPLLESSVVREAYEGKNFWAETEARGEPIPTAGEWERLRVKAYGQGAAKKGEDGHDHEIIAGHKVTHYNDTQKKREQREQRERDNAHVNLIQERLQSVSVA